MSAITTLIDKVDTFELVRDEIAAILKVESSAQEALAVVAGRDPAEWRLRVFVERSNPWAEFIDAPDDADPIINVSFDNENFDASSSNVVERQRATAVYHLDCYGLGVSQDDGATGHTPGDLLAALEAQRAVRLVRNILMAGAYAYLAHRGLVWRRWIQSIQMFQPALDAQVVEQVVAARISLQVDFNELSPQVEGQPLELIAATVKRAETGEIYLLATYDTAPAP